MKISDVVDKLNKLKEDHGDIEVITNYLYYDSIESISFVEGDNETRSVVNIQPVPIPDY